MESKIIVILMPTAVIDTTLRPPPENPISAVTPPQTISPSAHVQVLAPPPPPPPPIPFDHDHCPSSPSTTDGDSKGTILAMVMDALAFLVAPGGLALRFRASITCNWCS